MINDLGWNHVCFYVDQIEEAAELFVAARAERCFLRHTRSVVATEQQGIAVSTGVLRGEEL